MVKKQIVTIIKDESKVFPGMHEPRIIPYQYLHYAQHFVAG